VSMVINQYNSPVRICILGGGFGGLYTAVYLQQNKPLMRQNLEITLVEPKNHFLFSPLLYELLTRELLPWEIAPSIKSLIKHPQINHYQEMAETIDLDKRKVTLSSGILLNYDYLVLALGSQPISPKAFGTLEFIHQFRTLADAEKLDRHLWDLETNTSRRIKVAIIGGGPNGVELACKLADRLGDRGLIYLLVRGHEILKGLPRTAQTCAYRAITRRHIQLLLEAKIHSISPQSLSFSNNGLKQVLSADIIIWAAGIKSHNWLRQLPTECNRFGQLITKTTLQLPNYPEVFAMGDLAAVPTQNGKALPITAQVAYQQASYVAYNLHALVKDRRLKAFRYLHLGDMLTLGRDSAIVSSFGITLSGKLATIIRKIVYLHRLPTFRHRIRVASSRLPKITKQLKKPILYTLRRMRQLY